MRKLKLVLALAMSGAMLLTGCAGNQSASTSESVKNETAAEAKTETLSEAGTYTGEFDGIVITAPDTVLENATANTIVIAKEVGEGDVTFRNVQVTTLEVYGGGENSIHLEASTIDNVISHKEEGIVRIVVESETNVASFDSTNTKIVVKQGAEVAEVTAKANTEVIVEEEAKAETITVADETASVSVAGEVNTVAVAAPKATVVVEETAKVAEVKVEEKAADTKVTVNGTVDKVAAQAAIKVEGTGTIAAIDTEKEELVEVAQGATATQNTQVTVKPIDSTPAATPAPQAPVATPAPTEKPAATPAPTQKPAATPAPTEAPAHVHTYSSSYESPTCTESGGTTYVCTECFDVYSTDEPAKGHAYNAGTITTPATCAATGVKTFSCTRCDDSYTETVAIDADAHVEDAVNNKCSLCNTPMINGVVTDLLLAPHDTYTGLYKNAADANDTTIYVADKDSLVAFATIASAQNSLSGKTVELAADIDLAGSNWTPINAWDGRLNNTVFDGKSHTIKNMKITGVDTAGFIGANASSITIKNVTFDTAYVETNEGSAKYAGVVMGKNYSVITLEKVKVINSQVRCPWQAGGMVGFAEVNGPSFIDCSIEESFVGGSNCTSGALFGLGVVNITAENCTVKNVDVYTDMEVGLVGYLYGKTLTETNSTIENLVKVSEYPTE